VASPEAEARGATRSGALYVSPVGGAKRRLYGAGPEITNGLGAFLYAARFEPGFGRPFIMKVVYANRGAR
jgi:hypothetical protein